MHNSGPGVFASHSHVTPLPPSLHCHGAVHVNFFPLVGSVHVFAQGCGGSTAPSSTNPLQLSSRPLHTSAPGVLAVQFTHPSAASHTSVP